MEKVIEIEGLTKKYGEQTVVNNLDLTIGRGEIFGLLGPNGAGKSTTILMLLGLAEPDSGRMKVGGMDPVKDPIRVKRKVGYLPEDVGFYDDLSGLDNLLYTARLNQIPDNEALPRAEGLLKRVGLEEEMHKKAGKYSRGMRQRLGLADVLIKHPEVIILDEPTLGIDPAGIKDFLSLIVQLSRAEGLTVLFSSHLLHQVQLVCDRVGIFVKGRLIAVGNVGSLANQLFPESKMTIEMELVEPDPADAVTGSRDAVSAHLMEALEKVEGVVHVHRDGNHFVVESNREVGTVIAHMVLDSGLGLNHLNRKVYGLDEIYYRYFQGGTNDQEQKATTTKE
jgi:ABC-2 type transport system ATP-binding protein